MVGRTWLVLAMLIVLPAQAQRTQDAGGQRIIEEFAAHARHYYASGDFPKGLALAEKTEIADSWPIRALFRLRIGKLEDLLNGLDDILYFESVWDQPGLWSGSILTQRFHIEIVTLHEELQQAIAAALLQIHQQHDRDPGGVNVLIDRFKDQRKKHVAHPLPRLTKEHAPLSDDDFLRDLDVWKAVMLSDAGAYVAAAKLLRSYLDGTAPNRWERCTYAQLQKQSLPGLKEELERKIATLSLQVANAPLATLELSRWTHGGYDANSLPQREERALDPGRYLLRVKGIAELDIGCAGMPFVLILDIKEGARVNATIDASRLRELCIDVPLRIQQGELADAWTRLQATDVSLGQRGVYFPPRDWLLALLAKKLQRPTEGLAALQRYRTTVANDLPEGQSSAQLDRLAVELEHLYAHVCVSTNDATAELIVDGRRMGANWDGKLDPAIAHHIEVRGSLLRTRVDRETCSNLTAGAGCILSLDLPVRPLVPSWRTALAITSTLTGAAAIVFGGVIASLDGERSCPYAPTCARELDTAKLGAVAITAGLSGGIAATVLFVQNAAAWREGRLAQRGTKWCSTSEIR